MSRQPSVPRVVDDPDEARRSAVETQLLSLLGGFQRLHRLSQAEMCEVLLDVIDWISCPSIAGRVLLVDDDQADDTPLTRERGVS